MKVNFVNYQVSLIGQGGMAVN